MDKYALLKEAFLKGVQEFTMTKRRAIINFSYERLELFLRSIGCPDDIEILDVANNSARETVHIKVESKDYPEVYEGQEIMQYAPTIVR